MVRIAAQHRHVVPDLAQAVRLAQQVVGRGLGRPRPAREEDSGARGVPRVSWNRTAVNRGRSVLADPIPSL